MNSLSTKKPESSIPTKNLKDADISGKILEYIPQESAEHYKIVPVGVRDGVLEVGAIDPNNLEVRDALNFISSRVGMPYKLFLISQNDFEAMLEKYKGLSGEVTKALSELESELSESISKEGQKKEKIESTETKIVEDEIGRASCRERV